MEEMIIRLTDRSNDAEILVHDCVKDKDIFKAVSIKDLVCKMKKTFPEATDIDNYKEDMISIDEDVIAVSPKCIVVKQPEHKEIVMYAGKAFEINYPNSIYAIKHSEQKVKDIVAYCYKKLEGMQTQLYRHAMPNMFYDDKICMGTADRKIEPKNYKVALNRILYTQFTHAKPDNIKGFEGTSDYFRYLQEHEFPYDRLYNANKTLKQMVKEL